MTVAKIPDQTEQPAKPVSAAPAKKPAKKK
jgi:hypothetical protein